MLEDGKFEEQVGLRTLVSGPLSQRSSCAPKTVGELVDVLNRTFLPSDAEPWDRTGLLVGDPSEKLVGVACALDPTIEAVRKAARAGANLLITHHPAFLELPTRFLPLEFGASASGAVVYEAARLGVALANWHTALDVSAQAQMMLPGLLRLTPKSTLDSLERDASLGYGQICPIPADETLTLYELAARCTAVFGRAPRVWGTMQTQLSSVCTWTGAAGDAAHECVERGIGALVCGEIKYHAALDASQAGLAIIELGHDVSELPFARILAETCEHAGIKGSDIVLLDQSGAWAYPEARRV